MRLGIVADMHCYVDGLDTALEALAAEGVDELLCVGDAINSYRHSDEIVVRLRDAGARMVMGNHEQHFLEYLRPRLSGVTAEQEADFAWLAGLPRVLQTRVNGKRLLMSHGDPRNPGYHYVYPSNHAELAEIATLGFDIVVLGHTHHPMVKRIGRTLIVNPGSCGETRSPSLTSVLTCMVVDTVADEARVLGFPDRKLPSAPDFDARSFAVEDFE